jgi:hypothetical protein
MILLALEVSVSRFPASLPLLEEPGVPVSDMLMVWCDIKCARRRGKGERERAIYSTSPCDRK